MITIVFGFCRSRLVCKGFTVLLFDALRQAWREGFSLPVLRADVVAGLLAGRWIMLPVMPVMPVMPVQSHYVSIWQ
ncbi:hypothetical protein NHN17_15435 [Photobacterium sp. ZSDE20]|uniref:Uncharacterized protein n=1 Tax=Photobacterium pectinilyticum TaxID=2906793 RepID=A0ABT1N3W9_9GAMM|nr:hypothetical protein [Photobacterium sp. ZSDE20]MCQ1059443.1 hypothetical protein [Photobacterium sp. ZSDE20]